MPNLLAHNLVAKRLYIKEAEQTLPGKENFIAGNYDFLSLGAQGPDPLFYFGIVPFHAPHFLTARKKLGEKIHREDGRKFFKFLLEQCYGTDMISERHRHRYELNNRYRPHLSSNGLVPSGLSPDGSLVEAMELKGHPFFVGVQFHPEFKSRPNRPHPLFCGFIKASLEQHDKNRKD